MQGVNSFLTIRNGAIFTNNYSSTYGGALYLQEMCIRDRFTVMEAGFTAPDRVTVPAPELLKTRFWPAAVSAEPSMPHWAVSYTHLDVYKRQSWNRCGCPHCRPRR